MSRCLGARLSHYFGYDSEKKCQLKHSTWSKTPRYVVTVGVPGNMTFEAPALEEYLIGQLRPPDNIAGR